MIHPHKWLLILVLIVLFSSGFARAQQIPPKPDKEEIAAVRGKAFKLLESVADQLNTLQSRENRARIGSNLVGSLWKHDEERARSLLRVVQEEIRLELQKTVRPPIENARYGVFVRLRHDTVERVAKHDAEAALEFLKLTGPLDEEQIPYDLRDSERVLELRLAKQAAADNPDVALKLGRQALERGITRDLLALLWRMNRKHRPQAQILYKEIVEKLRGADFANDWNIKYFAQQLVQGFQPPEADAATYRELVGVFVTNALNNNCGNKLSDDDPWSGFCYWIVSSVREIEKFDSRAVRLRHWKQDSDSESNSMVLPYEAVDELVKEDAVEDLEALALKHPNMQPIIYQRLIQQAREDGDYQKARKYIERYVPDADRQRELLGEIDEEKKWLTVNEERLAQIQTRLAETPDPQQQVWFLAITANMFGLRDRNAALKLLNQASGIVDTMTPGKKQTESRLMLAVLYCYEKSDRGFAIMESVVPKLNELVDTAAKLDGYDTNYLRDGEWNMSANGSVGELLTNLSNAAPNFAWFDFDRAVSLSSQFERPEIRMMAHLKLAQGILAGPPKRVVQD